MQNLHGNAVATTIDQSTDVTSQAIPGGQIASQAAIKQFGSNGGGPYNANSAHPFENPTGFTDMMELFAILLIPFALVVTLGKLVRDKRQSRLLMVVMAGILVVFASFSMFAETNGNPELTALRVDQSLSTSQSGGNMEGKEVGARPKHFITDSRMAYRFENDA